MRKTTLFQTCPYPIINNMEKAISAGYKIVIIGPRTTIGQCVLGQLAKHGIPITLIRPLDIHQEAGKSIYYNNHHLVTQALDLFDFNAAHIIFVCDKKILPLIHRRKIPACNWCIDCTHSLKEAMCIIPAINGHLLKKIHPKWLCNPGSCVIALSRLLSPLLKTFQAESVQLVLLMGTVFEGQACTDKLLTQVRHFLTQTPLPVSKTFPKLAFNLIPDYFENLGTVTAHQLACFLSLPFTLQTCFIPVIRGSCTHVRLSLKRNYNPARLLDKLAQIPDTQLITNDTQVSLNDIITEEKLFLIHPIISHKSMSFWCLQDAIQQGIGTNAAAIAQLLLKMSA